MLKLMKKGPKMGSKEQGLAMAEFAIVLPLLLLITLGIIDLSMILIANTEVLDSATIAARRASISSSPAGCQSQLVEEFNELISSDSLYINSSVLGRTKTDFSWPIICTSFP